MRFIQKTAVALLAALFTFALFWFVLLIGMQQAIGSADNVKKALAKSGIYTTVVSDILAQAQKEQAKQPGTQEMDIPIDDTRVRGIISDAFPPEYLQTNTEKTLDSAYAWLEGDTPRLSFTIDLQDAKLRLADGLAAYAREKATTLPPCQPGSTPQGGELNIFEATCKPPGTDANLIAEQVRSEIVNGEFLKDTKLSADSIKNEQGQPLDEQLEQAPANYQRITQGIYALGAFTLLLGVIILFLSTSRRVGIRKIAIIAITVGTLTAISGWLASVVLGKLATSPGLDQPLQQTLVTVVKNLSNDACTWWIGLGLLLVALGIGALVALQATKPKKDPPEATGEAIKPPAKGNATGEESDRSEPRLSTEPTGKTEKKNHI